jgi:hypothetical protein
VGALKGSRGTWDRPFASEAGRVIFGTQVWEDPPPPAADPAPPKPPAARGSRKNAVQPLLPGVAGAPAATPSTVVSLLPALHADTVAEGSKQFVRVLWALRLAQEIGLAPQSAAELANLITEWGKVAVEGTNIARFFRTHYSKFAQYIHEVKKGRYALSTMGADMFERVFASSSTSLVV